MYMIDQLNIDQVLDRVDIVEVISDYVTDLKKKGSNYKCCCPFHNEKTPSFVVSPAKSSWHCYGCGEGGDAIAFLQKHESLSFPEAVKVLAAKYGIKVEERQLTPQEEQAQKKREALFFINQRCAEHWRENLKSKLGDSARQYAVKRFGAEMADEECLGFATDSWTDLADFAKASAMSLDLMVELGLLRHRKDGTHYDFYRNRLMFPIRDRYRRIIGFTARALADDDSAKYLNSVESDIYKKSRSIYGIDAALRKGTSESKFYAVEGTPDVLQLRRVGVENTVAPLGTAWTKEHFDFLKRYATRICFVPDADIPKGNAPYGTGIEKVMQNGVTAMQCGLSVSVKEIPIVNGEKADPGSYCTNKKVFDDLQETDFITWYANKRFLTTETTDERGEVVSDVAKLVVLVHDDLKEDMYLQQLRGISGTKNLWSKAIASVKAELIKAEKITAGKTLDRDLYRKYGFFEDGNAYFATGEKADVQWSNFIMLPMFHIKDSLMPKRLYRIINQGKQEEIIEMKQEDLVSLSKFRQKVEGLGNYIWLASERELTKLKMFLYEQTETALEITQLGWQRGGFFAFGNGCFDTEWHPCDDYGIVRLDNGNFYLPGSSRIYREEVKLFQFERKFTHTNFSTIRLTEITNQMIRVFGDNAKIGLCFLLATLYRDVITSYTKSFPILNLFGPKGSGKSELGHTLMSFFIIKNTPPNIQNATIAALGDAVAQCANALVHIDEYKNTIDLDKREFLKGLWDGTGRSRMNMDRDKKREITSVDCGVILSGQEMPTIDIALFSRLLFLTFDSTEFTVEQRKDFDKLKQMRDLGLSHLTLQILRHRKKFETDFYTNYNQCLSDLNDKLESMNIEDRILRNWLIPLAAFRTLESVVELPFSYGEMLQLSIAGVVEQNAKTKSNNELAIFWNTVGFLLQEGKINYGGDYRIEYTNRLKTNKVSIEYQTTTPVLEMRKSRIYMLYKMNSRQVGDTSLPEASLEYYLSISKEYLGVKKSVRFRNSVNGVNLSQLDQAMCFDYRALNEQYGINLEIDNSDNVEQAAQTGSPPPIPEDPSLFQQKEEYEY